MVSSYPIWLILFHRRTIFKMLALEQSAAKWPLNTGGGVVRPHRPPPPPWLRAWNAQRCCKLFKTCRRLQIPENTTHEAVQWLADVSVLVTKRDTAGGKWQYQRRNCDVEPSSPTHALLGRTRAFSDKHKHTAADLKQYLCQSRCSQLCLRKTTGHSIEMLTMLMDLTFLTLTFDFQNERECRGSPSSKYLPNSVESKYRQDVSPLVCKVRIDIICLKKRIHITFSNDSNYPTNMVQISTIYGKQNRHWNFHSPKCLKQETTSWGLCARG